MNGNGIKMSGRTSSQRSIQDYPEHLNPFYEDENHKRLRFWKIGSTDKSNRSNSFSIDGLKGLWSFKTFKLKKRSSTLGINKTSESPPMLRRGDDRYGSQATIDGSTRHTVDIGLTNNFQRGALARSSLQDLNSVSRGDNFFIRNNRYRSTMQAGAPGNSQSGQRSSNGLITPVFRSRYSQPPISKGSSQLSINSNPFEVDYETMSQTGISGRNSVRRASRKKRPAPQPPSPIKKADVVEEEPNSESARLNETVNITNLTAEIESFVRTADTDLETIESKQNEKIEIKEKTEYNIRDCDENSRSTRRSPENNGFYPKNGHPVELSIEKIQNLGEPDDNSNERCKRSPVKILIRAPTDEETTTTNNEKIDSSSQDFENQIEGPEQMQTPIPDVELTDANKDIQENVDSKVEETSELTVSETVTKDISISENSNLSSVPEEEVSTPISSSVEFILDENIKENCNTPVEAELKIFESPETELKIIESSETELKIIEAPETELKIIERNENVPVSVPKSNICVAKEAKTFEIRTVPLKWNSSEIKTTNFDVGAGKKPPTPPQRRRSVKEIIESINKCQSLLKVNQNFKSNKAEKDLFEASVSSKPVNDKNFMDNKIHVTNKKQYQEKHMFPEVSEVNNNENLDDTANIPMVVEEFCLLNRNNLQSDTNSNIKFEKCPTQTNKKHSNVE